MWSGPRNISTALMRSWGARQDTVVCDEPLYAYYLLQTGITHHPGWQEVVEVHEGQLPEVLAWLTGPTPAGKSIFYQKHMAHHLLPGMPVEWTDQLTNLLLIRDPREMLLSLTKVFESPSLEETGLPQQLLLFQRELDRTGHPPVVIDSRDLLQNPEAMLRQVCERVGVPFDPAMLSWRPGPHDTDGVWAKHWYDNVWKSTGFDTHRPREGDLPAEMQDLLKQCQEIYDQLAAAKLTCPTAGC
ncbi:hypothetical protein Pla123a_18960 [Posidoniimonas polymericola]|uniref:Sulfotransferase family protein n=2 Tax=Posidoniimonas polymericola TaxID=2528002 RepID=A0A5C5YQN5_9BACT|nr:hypothetical protein Pla123a_18960 [Posidoniimonas polymericola]